MRLLLDTHVLLWARGPGAPEPNGPWPPRRSDQCGVRLGHHDLRDCRQHALRKRSAPPFSGADAIRYCSQAGYILLDLTARHAAVLDTLPPLHTDPFDRLLVSQALSEPLCLMTHDEQLLAYAAAVIMV